MMLFVIPWSSRISISFLLALLFGFSSSTTYEHNSEEKSVENLEIFFTNYTRYLSQSIETIPNTDLRSDVKTLFSQVEPVLQQTITQKDSKQKTLKLQRIIKELRNIETLLSIVNQADNKGEKEKNQPTFNLLRENGRNPEKSSRIDDTKETYYYKTKDPIDTNLLLTVHKEFEKNTSAIPPWDPKSAIGKPATRPPYKVSWTPYTTPTPLPNRPDWNSTDWLEYFKHNHPNFWFLEQIQKNMTAEREKEKLLNFLKLAGNDLLGHKSDDLNIRDTDELTDPIAEESKHVDLEVGTSLDQQEIEAIDELLVDQIAEESEIDELVEDIYQSSSSKEPNNVQSKFFKDPLNPQPEEWLNWPPLKWVEWSESNEYKELYLNPLNSYTPTRVKQPDKVPIGDFKNKQPVLLTRWSTPQPRTPKPLKPRPKRTTMPPVETKGKKAPPPRSHFPKATKSPTRNPNYIYKKNFVQKTPYQIINTKNQVKDIRPQHIEIINDKRDSTSSLTSDYVFNEGFESSQLPQYAKRPLSNLAFDRYKDRDTGAVDPTMLLLTDKPFQYKADRLPASEGVYNPLNQYQGQRFDVSIPRDTLPNQQSFQEGASPEQFLNEEDKVQGSVPIEGSIQNPQSRPKRPQGRPALNRYRPPKFRPSRPGQNPNENKQRFQTDFSSATRNKPNLPDNSNLSPDVFLPPIDPNNPNFQSIYPNPNPGIPQNPYFPPNNPYFFPNQYPYLQQQQGGGASSSTSTSTGGKSAASAAASGGQASSSSTSVSNGGNSNNDNKYYECTGSQCDRVQVEPKPIRDAEENRNVFFQDPTTSTSTTTTTRIPNLLENITFPEGGGNQDINLNIPTGVSPPPDLQQAINRGGNINLNCDRVNGCATLIPPDETTTSTTTRRPGLRISIRPLFGSFNRGPEEELSPGTDTIATNEIRDDLLNNVRITDILDEVDELPSPGLGDDFINEVYEIGETSPSIRPGQGSSFISQSNRFSDLPNNNFQNTNNEQSLPSRNRVSSLPNNNNPTRGSAANTERVADIPDDKKEKEVNTASDDLKNIVKALSGLIQILNTTNQGRTKPKNKYFVTPVPLDGGHLGNKRYPVKNIIFDDEATFSKIKSHNLPNGENIYFNVKKQLPLPLIQDRTSNRTLTLSTTIPPHLIPLGPDGIPLVKPDGSFVAHGLSGQNSHLSQMFPYLTNKESFTTRAPPVRSTSTTTTESTTKVSRKNVRNSLVSEDEDDEEHKDMFTNAIEMMRDLPMDTKRHMLGGMMFTIPMAAVTMAAAGMPHLAIAPLATVIPTFLFAAFMDVNPPRDADRHGHHGDRNGNETHNRRHGISGIISALRDFNSHRRENQTLHITTGNRGQPGGHRHG